MKKCVFIIIICGVISTIYGQNQENISDLNTIKSWAQEQNKSEGLLIGGYGEVHYNQSFKSNIKQNGLLDVHRMVLLFGYNYSKKLSFYTEVEFEHVNEVAIEQAFINYKFNNFITLKSGLLLVPFGIINEYHEPTLFFSVERPLVDQLIVPSTWREIGVGCSGNITSTAIKYQLYLINGFMSFDGNALLNGETGLRSGRQKGMKSIVSSPSITGRLMYYGILGLKLGSSFYYGKTQSTLFNKLDLKDKLLVAQADSSIVTISMLDFDVRYQYKGLQCTGQVSYVHNRGTEAYNSFGNTSLAKEMLGYYIGLGYNVFRHTKFSSKLIPFMRYEFVDTHFSLVNKDSNRAFARQIITLGLNLKLGSGIVLKSDFQFVKNQSQNSYDNMLNLGIGVWFR